MFSAFCILPSAFLPAPQRPETCALLPTRGILASVFPTIPPPPRRLLVFARLPQAGRVKTRLAAGIGNDKALDVYRAMLRDVLDAVGPSDEQTEIEVLWAPVEDADGDSLREAFGDRPLAMQTGASLGDRLAVSFSERFFFHRTDRIIAVGVDEPRLTRALVEHAFELLESCEWVLGPTGDGGYYLIGCRGPSFNADVFRDIAWSTSSVFAATVAKIRGWQHTLAVLPQRRDIDVLEDLQHFANDCDDGSGSLAKLLQAWGWTPAPHAQGSEDS